MCNKSMGLTRLGTVRVNPLIMMSMLMCSKLKGLKSLAMGELNYYRTFQGIVY